MGDEDQFETLQLAEKALEQFKTAEEFENKFEFECKGPDSLGGFSGIHAPVGGRFEPITVAGCMAFPDCTCWNYRQAVYVMECLPSKYDQEIDDREAAAGGE